ncbi:bifunctional hydroxymethylpyrimidine kinase/phosphomethylpyrimidine kinase, partial [Campylobacter lari]|uniref:bifunctional hydroxymethylpyrimidine kinase/phosphomethylpyrimidine kinase n=1 Tax=Campylobacter lari TaxID=201 RepID=UPI00372D6E18
MIQAKTKTKIPILTIAGSDCSGGAGLQADLKTFSAHNLFGMSVVLSVVAENTARVISCFDIPTKIIDEQMLAIYEDIEPKAVKIGMLGSKEIITCVKENLLKFQSKNIVIDPVMFAKNGYALMPLENCQFFKDEILSLADVLTPNIPEAEFLCNFKILNEDDMKKAAINLFELGAK